MVTTILTWFCTTGTHLCS